MAPNVSDLRRDYRRQALRLEDAHPDAVQQFVRWFEEAVAAEVLEPNAMVLATSDGLGGVSARVVLLKDLSERGFVFFTNYESRKGRDLDISPRAALVFWWAELERQVRVEGRVEHLSDDESDRYFVSRPRGSQIGAWASPQSRAIESRNDLDASLAAFEARFEGRSVPRPPHWGGLRVVAEVVEFWQGRPNRMHDRVRYRLTAAGWQRDRLAP